ncbi:MAG: flippase-like domain-containing protein [Myxococcaceae bacterium]|nr:MAG: flippase-like domain-containing protein [Myxococcaceae bacterium]
MKRAVNLIASLLVTAIFMWWAFRDTDVSTQIASLKAANYAWVLPYFLCLTAIHVFRTLRWGALLSGLERVPFRKLNEASGIGFMMLLVLPFRLGEFARPFLIAQRSSIRRSAAMTSVVLERIVDGLFVAALFRVLLFFVPVNTEGEGMRYVELGSWLMFGLFGGGLVFLLLGLWHQEATVRLVRATVGRFSPGIADKVADIVDTFVGAMRQLPDGRHIALFFLYTVLYWAVNGFGMVLLARAFDCSGAAPGVACEPMNLSLFQSYIVMCVLVVGVMIPAAPGMVGTFQAAIKVGLGLFLPAAVVNAHGLAYANVLWLCQTVQQVLFGLVLLSISHMSFRELAGNMKKDDGDGAVTRSTAA